MANSISGDDNDNQLYGTGGDDILNGMGGNDRLYGNDGNDILAGGTGDDFLDGGRGNNTYLFNLGDGNDTIVAADNTVGKHSMVRFGEGITPDNLVAERLGMNLRLSIPGTQDSLQIQNFFAPGWDSRGNLHPFAVEELRFFDGATWDFTAVLARVSPVVQLGDGDDMYFGVNLDGGGGNDRLDAASDGALLRGGAGNDQLYGSWGNDVLIGGTGNDRLQGGAGLNIYRFTRGWGNDTVIVGGANGQAETAQIELVSVQSGTVALERADLDLVVRLKDGTDSITIKDYFGQNGPAQSVRIMFEGYEVWDAGRIAAAMTMPTIPDRIGTEVGDTMYGMYFNERMFGNGGDDMIDGFDGDDLIDGGSGRDNLIGGTGNDVLLGGEGDDVLQGGMGDDLLDGGAGSDVLDGGDGHNLIRFGRDSGPDILISRPNALQTVLLAADVRPEDVIVGPVINNELTVMIRGSAARLQMHMMMNWPVEGGTPTMSTFAELRFADGMVWDNARLLRQAYTGDDFNNSIIGSDGDDWIDGRGGDDMLDGRLGNDSMAGGAGNDVLRGDEGDDVLRGGQGDDLLDGGRGANTYRFAKGDGHDRILPVWDRTSQALQTVAFDAGINPSDVTVRYNNNGSVSMLELRYNHGADSIVVDGFRQQGMADLAMLVRFADGTVWNNAELDHRSLLGDDGFNELQGGEGNDVLDGQGGDDTLKGNGGDDTLLGGEGNDFLDGGMGNDTINGGHGYDIISAHDAGNDVFVFNMGDGNDTINYAPWQTGSDTIRFGQGISKADVHMWVSGSTLNISYGSGDIRVENFTQPDAKQTPRIATFAFADGASYSYGELNNHAPLAGAPLPNLFANGGKDFVYKLAPDAFFDPDQGDVLHYELRNEFGKPLPAWLQFDAATGTLSGKPGDSDTDWLPLVIKAIDSYGLAAESRFMLEVRHANQAPVVAQPIPDLQVVESDEVKLVIPAATFADPDSNDGGTMSASNLPAWLSFDKATRTFSGKPSYGDVGQYALSVTWTDNGGLSVSDTFKLTVTTAAAMTVNGGSGADILTGKSGNDTLNGYAGNDTLSGGYGADRMVGGLGDDTYYVDNGGDTVVELGSEGNDLVYASVSHTLAANVERITLTGSGNINATGNNLSNLLTGNGGANILDGGTGADTMNGGAGNDTYIVDNGSDVVVEVAGEGIDRVMSAVGRTLGANQEILTLTGTASIAGTGNALNNLIQGNSGINTLNGGDGYDILQGAGGNDNLSDSSLQGNVFDGGSGDDRLNGGNGADLFIGGDGLDSITTGNGADVIAFNRGDGQDTVAATGGADNTVSLGHGILYADLALAKSGSDLILNVGAGEQIAFKGWYAGGQAVGNLQMVIEGGADYVPGAGAGIHDNKIEQFDFGALVARFDALRAADPTLSSWSMGDSLAQFSSGGSDGAAIGGDLAYRYAIDDNLGALATTPALSILANAQFGTAKQVVQPASFLRDGTSMLY